MTIEAKLSRGRIIRENETASVLAEKQGEFARILSDLKLEIEKLKMIKRDYFRQREPQIITNYAY